MPEHFSPGVTINQEQPQGPGEFTVNPTDYTEIPPAEGIEKIHRDINRLLRQTRERASSLAEGRGGVPVTKLSRELMPDLKNIWRLLELKRGILVGSMDVATKDRYTELLGTSNALQDGVFSATNDIQSLSSAGPAPDASTASSDEDKAAMLINRAETAGIPFLQLQKLLDDTSYEITGNIINETDTAVVGVERVLTMLSVASEGIGIANGAEQLYRLAGAGENIHGYSTPHYETAVAYASTDQRTTELGVCGHGFYDPKGRILDIERRRIFAIPPAEGEGALTEVIEMKQNSPGSNLEGIAISVYNPNNMPDYDGKTGTLNDNGVVTMMDAAFSKLPNGVGMLWMSCNSVPMAHAVLETVKNKTGDHLKYAIAFDGLLPVPLAFDFMQAYAMTTIVTDDPETAFMVATDLLHQRYQAYTESKGRLLLMIQAATNDDPRKETLISEYRTMKSSFIDADCYERLVEKFIFLKRRRATATDAAYIASHS